MHQRHILFANVQGHGHVYPSLGLVSELVRRGHRISYVTTPLFADVVTAAGATVVPYKSEFDTFHVPAVITQADAETQLHLVYVRENEAILRAAEEGLGDDVPDLVVYDIFPFIAGRLLATRWGRPAVRLSSGFAANEHYSFFEELWKSHGQRHPADVPAVNSVIVELLARYGVHTPVRQFWNEIEDLNIIFLPRSFQPFLETFDDERFAFVGPTLDHRPVRTGWQPSTPGTRVVLVSLGNQFNEHPEFFRTCAEAFADTRWQTVLAIGGFLDPAVLQPLPPNAEAHPWIPFHEVLPHADACVTHGTTGAVLESLAAGVPLVLVPHYATEAAPSARRVVELGLGHELTPEQVEPATIRATVQRLCDDPALRERVERMQREILAAGGTPAAADRIEQYLDRTGR
jgi:MGT family glycosyltransferase